MRIKELAWILAVSASVSACGKHDNGSGGMGNQSPLKPKVDLSGALGLLVVDSSQTGGSGGARVALHNLAVSRLSGATPLSADTLYPVKLADTSAQGTDSLKKTDSNGNVSGAISVPDAPANNPQNGGPPQVLPMISTIAVSPIGEVFLHFKDAFRHKAADPSSTPTQGDQREDGTYCQLFRVKGGKIADLQATPPTAENLECLDYNHFINNWQFIRSSVFQFDSAGNVYFPGSIVNSPKTIVYKWDRVTGALTEMVNSNICVNDFVVTPSGGLFYTGSSSCNGGGSNNGGGFFRYVNASGTLTEIARDWWNFIFDPITGASGDQAVFFGPDPNTASTASWNSACLFSFDPSLTPASQAMITCGSNVWDWVNMTRASDITTYGHGYNNPSAGDLAKLSAYKTEYANRCVSSGQVFAGGGSQISAILQDTNTPPNTYVIGNVQKKNAGTMNCSVEIRGPHCKNVLQMPDPTLTDSVSCTNASGTWVDSGHCADWSSTVSGTCFGASKVWVRDGVNYNGVTTGMCTAAGEITSNNWWSVDNTVSFQNAADSGHNTLKYRVNQFNCTPPPSTGSGDQWTSEYIGMAKVDTTTNTLKLISSPNEQAINLWLVNNSVYYSSFDSNSHQYKLTYYDGTVDGGGDPAVGRHVMATNFEVYNLNDSGITGKLYFDGLDFSNNSYTFGTMSTSSPYTRTAKTGLTGTLKTIVILPK